MRKFERYDIIKIMTTSLGLGFIPEEIIFCPTSACNLKCSHCFVNQKAGNLNAEDAVKLLKDCAGNGVTKVGFSGGEPFLNLDFTCYLIEESVKSDMIFDRLMTNGVWWKTDEELRQKLLRVKNAGFDGKIGLSWDCFHMAHEENTALSIQKIAMFITACHQIFDDETCVEILSVVNAADSKNDDLDFKDNLIDLGLTIGGYVTGETHKKTKNGQLAIINAYSDLEVQVFRFSQSFLPESEGSVPSEQTKPVKKLWKDKKWFTEDYCQSTGNVLYVHSDGRVAPCCGFANEEPKLIIGNVKDSYEKLMENARSNKMVNLCYCHGLDLYRRNLEKTEKMPGKTADMCMFCAWVCKRS